MRSGCALNLAPHSDRLLEGIVLPVSLYSRGRPSVRTALSNSNAPAKWAGTWIIEAGDLYKFEAPGIEGTQDPKLPDPDMFHGGRPQGSFRDRCIRLELCLARHSWASSAPSKHEIPLLPLQQHHVYDVEKSLVLVATCLDPVAPSGCTSKSGMFLFALWPRTSWLPYSQVLQSRLKDPNIARISSTPEGDESSRRYRIHFLLDDQPLSPWHDVPLKNSDGSYNFLCEIPKWTRILVRGAGFALASMRLDATSTTRIEHTFPGGGHKTPPAIDSQKYFPPDGPPHTSCEFAQEVTSRRCIQAILLRRSAQLEQLLQSEVGTALAINS